MRHVDFEGWQFVCRDGAQYEDCDPSRPIVCFGSFQDYLGVDSSGGIKARHEWVRLEDWDLVVFDEYHFGAWRDSAKKLFASLDEDDEKADHMWHVRQIFSDPEGDHDFAIAADVDLDATQEEGEAVFANFRVGFVEDL